jgi:tellurite resistance protein
MDRQTNQGDEREPDLYQAIYEVALQMSAPPGGGERLSAVATHQQMARYVAENDGVSVAELSALFRMTERNVTRVQATPLFQQLVAELKLEEIKARRESTTGVRDMAVEIVTASHQEILTLIKAGMMDQKHLVNLSVKMADFLKEAPKKGPSSAVQVNVNMGPTAADLMRTRELMLA